MDRTKFVKTIDTLIDEVASENPALASVLCAVNHAVTNSDERGLKNFTVQYLLQKPKSKYLTDGRIRANEACPFLKECPMKDRNCPQEGYLRETPFSCATARLFVIIKRDV